MSKAGRREDFEHNETFMSEKLHYVNNNNLIRRPLLRKSKILRS